ncbi:O-antigen ligase family protein [Bacillus sp. FJAT-50079]|uniref:O-antigen ligase family protein n=1 Tax=Bacillus sp. FJAT-50079 TaxID=2833577 RepID=UPI001BC98A21|nr:O-antigen ligase family protein [Bacillus sp. FJAT-50079]MBS4206749.1 O-antigen ligase family protein [Bacillus sp. FJAT-50079]
MINKAFIYVILFLLIFMDPFIFNFAVGPIHLTLLRLIIFLISIPILYQYIVKRNFNNLAAIKSPIIFFAIWFIYGFASLAWATDKIVAVKELYYFFIFLLLILILINLLDDEKMIKVMDRSFWGIGVITIFICLMEIFTGFHLGTSRYVIEVMRTEEIHYIATAFFYNENDLSLFLVMIAPFYYLKIFGERKLYLKIINAFVMSLLFYVIIINGSRVAILAIFIQTAALLYIKFKPTFYRIIRSSILFLPVFIVFIFLNIDKITPLIAIYNGYGSNFVRLNLYLNGLYSVYQSFMLGVGPGNFEKNIFPMFITNGIVNPHNWWIELLTNYGFLVFSGYLLFFIYHLKKLFKIYKEKNIYSNVAIILFISQIGFIFASIGPSRLFYYWPMWVNYAIILAIINLNERKNNELFDAIYEGDLNHLKKESVEL